DGVNQNKRASLPFNVKAKLTRATGNGLKLPI
ncbi:MAG: hypothetical protein RLZZ152_2184, partial [Pseudomonadota bacterium]